MATLFIKTFCTFVFGEELTCILEKWGCALWDEPTVYYAPSRICSLFSFHGGTIKCRVTGQEDTKHMR